MAYAYTTQEVLDLFGDILRQDLELDYERDDEKNRIRVKMRLGGTSYYIVCSCNPKSQVIHMWAFLPFDVENEDKAILMARACRELNSLMMVGKYTYDLDKDVALELAHCVKDGIDREGLKRLFIGIFCSSLKDDGQRMIDLYEGKLSFDRFKTLIREN